MTDLERAEKILDEVGVHFYEHMVNDDCIPFIAAQIDEAVEEGIEGYAERSERLVTDSREYAMRKARAEALEEAAKVAYRYGQNHNGESTLAADEITVAIRALADGGEK
jgi:hypothetical protein